MFNDTKPYVVFQNVEIARKWTSGKGTKCIEVAWMGGSKMIYDDGLYDAVEEGQQLSFRGNLNGDFVKDCEIMGAAAPKSKRQAVA